MQRIHLADSVAAGMLGQHPVAQQVVEHAFRLVGGDVRDPAVVVLLVLAAQVAQRVEEVACEQPDADAQLQHEDFVFQLPVLVGGDEAREEDIGRIA